MNTLPIMPQFYWDKHKKTLQISGAWNKTTVQNIIAELARLPDLHHQSFLVDVTHLKDIDTVGALLFYELLEKLKQQDNQFILEGLSKNNQVLLNLTQEKAEIFKYTSPALPTSSVLYKVGKESSIKFKEGEDFLSFIGDIVITFSRCWLDPRRIQWRSIVAAIEGAGFYALPIVAMLAFLIGVVLTYQMGVQLQTYGVEGYIVYFAGVAILREFAPLITAIIVAGRTGAAYAALIGTMKVNEEIDALKTMGLSPTERLVLPRFLGLIIALPLLTVWADMFGILGSMIMAKQTFHIGYQDFLGRFNNMIELKDYLIGLSKTPVFAMIIATVGCFQGFQVSMSADSVGRKTTKSVVQAIFLIIIADAIFSIILTMQGI